MLSPTQTTGKKARAVVRVQDIDIVEGSLSDDDGLLVAGQRVPAGRYRRVDIRDGEAITVGEGECLPASFDGHVAVYERVPQWQPRWPN